MRTNTSRSLSRRIAIAAVTVAAATVPSACSSTSGMSSSSPASQTAQVNAPATGQQMGGVGQHMAASDFSTAVHRPGTIVLDVRTPAEFASGHLAGARNVDIEGANFASRIAALDKSGTYAVYCRSGNRSGRALEQMTAAGFTHTFDLTGGIGAWKNMGGPMTMGRS